MRDQCCMPHCHRRPRPQVADKLCDRDAVTLAKALATQIRGTDWHDQEASDAIERAVIPLSHSAQQLVLQQLGDILTQVISCWPTSMQYVRFAPARAGLLRALHCPYLRHDSLQTQRPQLLSALELYESMLLHD